MTHTSIHLTPRARRNSQLGALLTTLDINLIPCKSLARSIATVDKDVGARGQNISRHVGKCKPGDRHTIGWRRVLRGRTVGLVDLDAVFGDVLELDIAVSDVGDDTRGSVIGLDAGA